MIALCSLPLAASSINVHIRAAALLPCIFFQFIHNIFISRRTYYHPLWKISHCLAPHRATFARQSRSAYNLPHTGDECDKWDCISILKLKIPSEKSKIKWNPLDARTESAEKQYIFSPTSSMNHQLSNPILLRTAHCEELCKDVLDGCMDPFDNGTNSRIRMRLDNPSCASL